MRFHQKMLHSFTKNHDDLSADAGFRFAFFCDSRNEEEGLCTASAPREASYAAQARNQAVRRNIDETAETATVRQGKIEVRTAVCPKCGKPAGTGIFCNESTTSTTRSGRRNV